MLSDKVISIIVVIIILLAAGVTIVAFVAFGSNVPGLFYVAYFFGSAIVFTVIFMLLLELWLKIKGR